MAVRSPKDFKDRATAPAVLWGISLIMCIRRFILLFPENIDFLYRPVTAITNSLFSFGTGVAAGFVGMHVVEKETWK